MLPIDTVDYLRFPAELVRVVDGDTFDLDVDLGFNLKTRKRFRLRGVNCPESRGTEKPAGLLCAEYVEFLLSEYDQLMIRTFKSDSFGRWLFDIELSPRGELLSESLCELGYALPWEGRGSRPKFDPFKPYPIPALEIEHGKWPDREGVGISDS